MIRHTVELTEKNFTMNEMMRDILPSGIDPPSSFEVIGHIAHLNLRPEHLPHRHKIAEIIMKKGPNIRTVVNKVGVSRERGRKREGEREREKERGTERILRERILREYMRCLNDCVISH